jgi:hypothetical protein
MPSRLADFARDVESQLNNKSSTTSDLDSAILNAPDDKDAL